MAKIKVGIYGAAGYTAGELIRLLVHHPDVELSVAQSESQAGKAVDEVHTDLIGDIDLAFERELEFEPLDVLFLCKGHGESTTFVKENGGKLEGLKLIDLSHDFRARSNDQGFVYGLPEINKAEISQSSRVANPGCFATCIQLGLLPAAQHQLIDGPVNTSGITGSTGAGQSLTPTSHFSWRNNNISVYKAFTHQHLSEIRESLVQLDGRYAEPIHFIPYRGNFTRGIITTSYFPCDATLEVVRSYYQAFYADHPFVRVVDQNPDVKQVVNTNKVLIYLEKHADQLMVISLIDNLLKGASGQALQNMNLMLGLEEETGLLLKSTVF
ncbi:MAG: N-acetyl-gamma-glutamyl-phosphate reductase [Bacteroidota bacterium]